MTELNIKITERNNTYDSKLKGYTATINGSIVVVANSKEALSRMLQEEIAERMQSFVKGEYHVVGDIRT